MMTEVTIPATGEKINVDLGVVIRQQINKQEDGTLKETFELVRIYQLN